MFSCLIFRGKTLSWIPSLTHKKKGHIFQRDLSSMKKVPENDIFFRQKKSKIKPAQYISFLYSKPSKPRRKVFFRRATKNGQFSLHIQTVLRWCKTSGMELFRSYYINRFCIAKQKQKQKQKSFLWTFYLHRRIELIWKKMNPKARHRWIDKAKKENYKYSQFFRSLLRKEETQTF